MPFQQAMAPRLPPTPVRVSFSHLSSPASSMKNLLRALLFLALSLGLCSCGAIAESLIEGMFNSDDEDEPRFESREKRQRHSDYRSGNKPTLLNLQFDSTSTLLLPSS